MSGSEYLPLCFKLCSSHSLSIRFVVQIRVQQFYAVPSSQGKGMINIKCSFHHMILRPICCYLNAALLEVVTIMVADARKESLLFNQVELFVAFQLHNLFYHNE